MEVILYSTHCPKCNILEKKLTQKGINFTIVDDQAEVVKLGKDNKIMSAPILQVNNAVFDFSSANAWINDAKEPEETIDCKEECKF